MTDTETLRALAQTLTTDYKLAGPWGWFGDTCYQPPYLATVHGGRQFVLGTQVRYELCDRDEDGEVSNVREVDRDEAYTADDPENVSLAAELTFPHRREGDPWSSMVRADKLPIFEVAPTALDVTDPAVYRTQVNGLRNPVATYLAAVDPTTILALLDRIAALESELEAVSTRRTG